MSRRKLLKKIMVVVGGFFTPLNLISFATIRKKAYFQTIYKVTVPQAKFNSSNNLLKDKPIFMNEIKWRKICSNFPPLAFISPLNLDWDIWENLLKICLNFTEKHLIYSKILQKENIFLLCHIWDSQKSYCRYFNQINASPFHRELAKNDINFITLKGKKKYLNVFDNKI